MWNIVSKRYWYFGLSLLIIVPGMLALIAFGLPLAQLSRHGVRTVVWGQVRPGHGRRKYVLQRWNGRRWAPIGSAGRTASSGPFARVIRARPGDTLRIWTPVAPGSGPQVIHLGNSDAAAAPPLPRVITPAR